MKEETMVRVYHFTNSYALFGILGDGFLKCSQVEHSNDWYERSFYGKVGTPTELNYICFCESLSNPVMWYFYTGKCTGACLEIELTESDGDLINIEYIDAGKIAESDYEEDAKKYLSVKSRFWEFEQEKRLFLPNGDKSLKLDGKLRSIVLAPSFEYDKIDEQKAGLLFKYSKKLKCVNSTICPTGTFPNSCPPLIGKFKEFGLL